MWNLHCSRVADRQHDADAETKHCAQQKTDEYRPTFEVIARGRTHGF